MQKRYENKLRLVRLEDGTLGKVLIARHDDDLKGKELFYAISYGRYYEKELPLLETLTYIEGEEEDYIEYLTESFSWGAVIDIHIIGEYQIVEYECKDGICFHAYINYNDTSISYNSLDEALTGTICKKFEGGNGRVNSYLWMILDNYRDE